MGIELHSSVSSANDELCFDNDDVARAERSLEDPGEDCKGIGFCGEGPDVDCVDGGPYEDGADGGGPYEDGADGGGPYEDGDGGGGGPIEDGGGGGPDADCVGGGPREDGAPDLPPAPLPHPREDDTGDGGGKDENDIDP